MPTPPSPPPGLIIRLIIIAVFGPAVLLLAGGDEGWTWGWILAGFMFVYSLAGRWAIWKKNPDLIIERRDALKKDNVEPGDKILLLLLGVVLPTLTTVGAGLDHRFGWSSAFPPWLSPAAFAFLVFGTTIAQWAVLVNPYFSATIRIQADRGQTVVSSGPYRFIRHPGYAGGLLFNLGLPLVLGSWWAGIPALATAALVVLRTAREDAVLLRKLPGYPDYAARTRVRLLPGLW
jgi:protein-S-isoprenylcysteine O-methyltransferase Ste14